MKKKFLMPMVIVAVFALTACSSTSQDNSENNLVESEDDSMFTGGVSGLLGMNKKQKCTWSENGKVMGVVYVDGEKMRSESNAIVVGDKDGNMLMINDGEYMYTWSDKTKEGMKIKNIDEDELDMPDMDMPEEHMDEMEAFVEEKEEEIFDYKCENWKADSKMFVPPTDVNFQDMNQMMESMQGAIGGSMEEMCDFAPEAERAECLASMKEAQ